MSRCFATLRGIHRFWVNHLLYPLVLSSLLASALSCARVYVSQRPTYHFLVWNLFLAWLPYLFALSVTLLHQRFPRYWWLWLAPATLWLLFLPNAPYLITDLWHLEERRPIPLWYDIGMLATFAWTGLFLGVASLNAMQRVVRDYCGRIVSWLFVFGAIGASGLGIYLGRFLNWNSWDIVLRPRSVIADIVARFGHPIQNPGAFGFTFRFAAFMLVCYLTFVSVEHCHTEKIR
jgi:uncharacterized membrane protein